MLPRGPFNKLGLPGERGAGRRAVLTRTPGSGEERIGGRDGFRSEHQEDGERRRVAGRRPARRAWQHVCVRGVSRRNKVRASVAF